MNPGMYLFSVGAILIWAVNAIINRLAAGLVDPATISFARWLIAGVALGVVFARPIWRQRRLIRPHLGQLTVLGLLGMVIYQCLAYEAAHTTTATNMGLISSLVPLFAAAFGAWLLDEPPTLGTLAGGALSLTGLAILLGHGRPEILIERGLATGDVLMLLAAVAYALYGVLIKRWALPLDLWVSLTLQILTVLPVLLLYYVSHGLPPVPARSLPLILYAGIPASILAPWLWMKGLAVLGPARASATINLMPVFIAAIATQFLGEQFAGYHLIGGTMTLAGVILSQKLTLPLFRTAAA
ncbi:DMT family transporter [Paludibacterium paludis]|uniref:DMT family transporter n=1 Tax=Paludibacterium paludis TaxID=1225769 RepID=UPI001C04201C|nr:DMT family transporter [Paludibacterium paludis]